MERMNELRDPLSPAAQRRDAGAYIDFLAAQSAVRPGSMGVVGYCFTGAMAMRTAAVRPSVTAMASFHGGGLYKAGDPDSPHLVLPQVAARLYFGHAVEDRSMDAEAIKHLERALAEWGGRYESETYEGAHHSWTVPDSPVFNPVQADRAFGKLTELFRETLG
jgi:carboxymethylenebutenolidase